ncbi:MAG: hypothetical protein V4488_10005 [Pseudomonadota bacterium]
MTTSQHMRTIEQTLAAIQELDLEPIKFKLMAPEGDDKWSQQQADFNELGYRRFLTLIAKYPDASFAPSKDVDKFWHGHILDTLKYAEDCQAVFGHFLHHFPYLGLRGEEDAAERIDAARTMDQLYLKEFGVSCFEHADFAEGAAQVAYSGPAGAAAYSGPVSLASGEQVAYSGPVSLASGEQVAYSGPVSMAGATQIAYSGPVSLSDGTRIAYSGPVTGKQVAYSGPVSATQVAYSGPVSATQVAYSGPVGAVGMAEVAYSGPVGAAGKTIPVGVNLAHDKLKTWLRPRATVSV